MADLIAIVGESGSGKSTSIERLNPEETFIINVANKPLPFRGWKSKYKSIKDVGNEVGNYIATSKVPNIEKLFEFLAKKRPEIKNVIIEDKHA